MRKPRFPKETKDENQEVQKVYIPTVKEMLEDPLNSTTESFNFYAWKCNTNKLKNRMQKLIPKIKFLVKSGLIDENNTKILFRNDITRKRSFYDSIRIVDMDENVLGGISLDVGDEHKKNIWYVEYNEGKVEPYEAIFDNWSSFKNESKTDQELRDILQKYWKK